MLFSYLHFLEDEKLKERERLLVFDSANDLCCLSEITVHVPWC